MIVTPPSLPRLSLPGVEPMPEALLSAIRADEEHSAFIRRQKRGVAQAMVVLGKPIFKRGRRKAPRPSPVRTYAARMGVRSAYLKEVAGC